MRIWSIHPKYLDTKGLLALWREGLLAKAVLRGTTIGYRSHPQLIRFKSHPESLSAIHTYLRGVLEEAKNRGFSFDAKKIEEMYTQIPIPVTRGQVNYEYQFLCEKLRKRDPALLEKIINIKDIVAHPMMEIVEGKVEYWEKVK